jgi:hypothetical protein
MSHRFSSYHLSTGKQTAQFIPQHRTRRLHAKKQRFVLALNNRKKRRILAGNQ